MAMAMTQKQRFLTAVRGEQPDVVPVAPLIHCRFAHKMLGRTDWKAVYEVHRMLGSCHHRGPVGVGWHCEMPDGYTTEGELVSEEGPRRVNRNVMRTPLGELTCRIMSGFAPDDPIISQPIEHYVKEKADWEIFRDFHQKRVEGFKGYATDTAEEAYDLMGEDGMPSIGIGCALSIIGTARGMEGMLYDLVDYPDLMESVRQVVFAGLEKSFEAFLETRSEVSWYDICWVTGAHMGPEMFRKWCLPEVERVVEIVHSKPGKYIGLYTLGRIGKLMPMLVDSGVDFIETFEPNEGDMSLGEAKRLYGDRVCLMGNFDCNVLARGTVEQARTETRRCLEEAMEGGGYVLVTADEVPANAKLENLKAMVETVEEHGRY